MRKLIAFVTLYSIMQTSGGALTVCLPNPRPEFWLATLSVLLANQTEGVLLNGARFQRQSSSGDSGAGTWMASYQVTVSATNQTFSVVGASQCSSSTFGGPTNWGPGVCWCRLSNPINRDNWVESRIWVMQGPSLMPVNTYCQTQSECEHLCIDSFNRDLDFRRGLILG